jgi:putative transposase
MGRSRYRIFEDGRPYFVTCTIVNWLPLFSRPPIVRIVSDSLTFLQRYGRIVVYAYVIMENHLHLVLASEHLSKELGDFKSYTAREIVRSLEQRNASRILEQLQYRKLRHKKDRQHQVWQEDSHPQQIQGVNMMHRRLSTSTTTRSGEGTWTTLCTGVIPAPETTPGWMA